MKKLRLVLLIAVLTLALIALTSCMGCVEHQDFNKDGKCDVCFAAIDENDEETGGEDEGEEDGGEENGTTIVAPTSFSISADSTAVYSGATVGLSICDGAILGSYTASDVVYTALGAADTVSCAVNGNSVELNGVGTVRITASIGGKLSDNEITVAVLPSNSLLAENIGIALSAENAYLGVRHNVGLTADTVGYYKIVGEEDYVRFNADGTLEIIGARAKNSIITVTGLGGGTVYENFYTLSASRLVAAIREALLAEGKIASAAADIPASKIAEVESLSLSSHPVVSEREYSCFKYLTSLKRLDMSNNYLGDLAYLKGLDQLTLLDLGYANGLDLSDNGIAVCNSLKALSALEKLSVAGSLSYFNRQVYDTVHTMVANGEIELEVLDGIWLSAADIDSFSDTVFFSIEECKEHAEKHNGAITPSGEWTHAIISIPADDYNKYFKVYADNIALLELFGSDRGYSNAIQVYSEKSLAVNLYNFALSAPRKDFGIGLHIDNTSATDTTLRITAKRGSNYVKGADWHPAGFPLPGEAIVCDNLEVYTENGATISVVGGLGFIGSDGGWGNGPEPGGRGGDGANAIMCNEAWFYTYDITVQGGNGGAGGKGGNGGGALHESVLGYYNGAKGGDGGTGGYALYCPVFHTLDMETGRAFIYECLFGGSGGIAGDGGDGKALGHKGDPGDPGSDGKRYLGEVNHIPRPGH